MTVKKLNAPSIHAALNEARRLYGDDVVLLESVPPSGGQPARITVMVDSAAAQAPAQRPVRQRPAPAATAPQGDISALPRPPQAPVRYGYQPSAGQQDVAVLEEEPAGRFESNSTGSAREQRPDQDGYEFSRSAEALLAARRQEPAARDERRTAGRGQLFPSQAENVEGRIPTKEQASAEALENLLQKQLKVLHERLDLMESRFGGAIIGAAQRWAGNPLFVTLLEQGMRPSTLSRLFDGLAARGFEPDADQEVLKWALAQELRRTLNLSVPEQTPGARVFIGPSGSGKTSLLLKLAMHPSFYGRRQAAVIVISPEDSDGLFYQNPVDVFRRYGLPVQSVSSVDEMAAAIRRVQHFDHILIDTPPMPVREAAARKMLLHVKRMVDPILPLQVQMVVNATRSLDDLTADRLQRLPLRPDVVALTHLDETLGWGRMAEWLLTLRSPVQFCSTSDRVPDGLLAFSPTWFVEELMKL